MNSIRRPALSARRQTVITLMVKLRPFTVPNFVIQETEPGKRQDGFKEAPSYPLSAVSPETLSAMCDEFRASVYAKAGVPDPRLVSRGSEETK